SWLARARGASRHRHARQGSAHRERAEHGNEGQRKPLAVPAIKTRLTISYVAVLMATMLVFAFALWSGQRSRAAEALTAQVRRSTPEVRKASDGIISMIRAAQSSGKQLTYVDTINGARTVVATQSLAALLDPVPAYFLLFDNGDKLLYSSSLVRML